MDAAQLKAEELNNSRPLDVWRVSEYPEAQRAIDHIYQEIADAGLVSKRFASKWRDTVRAVVLDLYVAHVSDPTMYIGYSRNHNKYSQSSRYSALFFSVGILPKVVDYLKDNGYIDHHGHRHDKKNPAKSRQSRMRATSKLIDLVQDQYNVDLSMISRHKDEEVIILRDKKKKDIEYEDTPDTIRMRDNLNKINEWLEYSIILLEVTDEELKELQGRLKRKIDFTDKRLRRIFNNGSFEQGGRFYGGWWQNIPREYRKFIRVEGKDVVEVDYSGFHINMLYAMDGLDMHTGDVYKLPGYSNSKVFRDFVKTMLLAMVNSDSRELTRKALHKEVHKKRTLTLPAADIPSTKVKDLYPVMDAFQQKHHDIADYFNSGKGIDLQNIDSHISEQVLLRFCGGKRLPVLPMHDSFIVHHHEEPKLRKAMDKAFNDRFRVKCKVDLKYNSIDERQKLEEGEAQVCTMSVEELMDYQAKSGTYNSLLETQRRRRTTLEVTRLRRSE